MKTKKYRYAILFLVSVICLLAICSYTIGYTTYLKQVDKDLNKTKHRQESIKRTHTNENITNLNEETINASNNNIKITDVTVYKVIEVDLVTTRKLENVNKMPNYFVGLSKNEIERYFENYIGNMPVDEVAKGLQTINILSFSKDEVVIEKIYDASMVGYFIVDKAGEIKVYYNDKRTLYENTGIITASLPQTEKEHLEEGILVDSQEEMLAILESYSS